VAIWRRSRDAVCAGKPDANDPIERASSRPDFLVLGYPWLGAVGDDFTHLNYCKVFNLMTNARHSVRLFPGTLRHQDTPPPSLSHF